MTSYADAKSLQLCAADPNFMAGYVYGALLSAIASLRSGFSPADELDTALDALSAYRKASEGQ